MRPAGSPGNPTEPLIKRQVNPLKCWVNFSNQARFAALEIKGLHAKFKLRELRCRSLAGAPSRIIAAKAPSVCASVTPTSHGCTLGSSEQSAGRPFARGYGHGKAKAPRNCLTRCPSPQTTDVDVLPSDTSWISETTTGVHKFGEGSGSGPSEEIHR
jgi:hypothetical protein